MVKIEIKCAQLNDKSWGTWAPRVMMVLTLEGNLNLVTNGFAAAQATPAELVEDAKAKAVIGAYLSDDHLARFRASDCAKLLRDTLEGRFNQQNHTRRLTLRRDLTNMNELQTKSLSTYFARAMQLRDDLRGADHAISEEEVVSAVLSGLPRQYDVAVAIMEQSERALTMDGCLNKLLVVEHRLGKADSGEPAAFFSKADFKQSGGGSGGGSGSRGGSGSGFKGGNSSRDTRTCWKCGKVGHLRKDCRQLQKQPNTASVSFASVHMACAESIPAEAAAADWIMDTGASHHMTPHKGMFVIYRSADSLAASVRVADGSMAAVAGAGDVLLVTSVKGRLHKRKLTIVLHVPDLKHSLFSMSTFNKKNTPGVLLDMSTDVCQILLRDLREDSEFDFWCYAEAHIFDGLFWIRGADPEGPEQIDWSPTDVQSEHVPCAAAAAAATAAVRSDVTVEPVEAVPSTVPVSPVASKPVVSDVVSDAVSPCTCVGPACLR